MTGRARGGLFGLTALLVAGVCFYDPLLRWAFSAVAAWFQDAYGPTPVRSLALPPATLARMLAFVWVHPVETGAWVVIACSITGGVLTHLVMRRRFSSGCDQQSHARPDRIIRIRRPRRY